MLADPALRDLLHRRPRAPPLPAAHAPIASGWSNSCRVGQLPPTGSTCPFHGARILRVRREILARLRSLRYELVRMLKPELLRVLALTGASVTISDVPGVISLRAFARNIGSMDMRLARSLRFGTRLPTLAIDSQSRRPPESTVANAEKAYEPRIPLSLPIGARPISTPLR